MAPKKRYSIIPCGVDMNLFQPMEKQEARWQLGLDPQVKYVLFPSAFSDEVKNYPLAKKVLDHFPDVETIELSGYTRQEVNLLLNACDLVLMTSLYEGSPQVIKEAVSCNCPIISTGVGDVADVIGEIEGCYVTSYNVPEIVTRVEEVLSRQERTNSREKIQYLSGENMAVQIYQVYQRTLALSHKHAIASVDYNIVEQ